MIQISPAMQKGGRESRHVHEEGNETDLEGLESGIGSLIESGRTNGSG
jgi:hypothetical protein